MSSSITPALMRHWAVHAGLIYAYSFFRVAYADAPSMAKSPSYLISLGIVPHDATQEVDLFAVTLVLSAQKWRRSTNNFEFAETLIWYLQLAVGALLALTDARPCIAYAALVIVAWTLFPVPPLPLGRLGFSLLTPFELAVLASKKVASAASFVSGGGVKKDSAVIVAGVTRSDEAAISASEAFRRKPRTQLWFADLSSWPDVAASLRVDTSVMSLEVPSVLALQPGGGGKTDKRLPLKSEHEDPSSDEPAHVRTVRMSADNMRRYFALE